MRDELKQCPACGKNPFIESFFSEYTGDRKYKFTCNCGVSGPWAWHEKDAIVAWNDLPRAPQWTEYDGTESTFPKAFDFVLVESEYLGCPTARRTLRRYNENGIEILGEPLEIGNRWIIWPGDSQ